VAIRSQVKLRVESLPWPASIVAVQDTWRDLLPGCPGPRGWKLGRWPHFEMPASLTGCFVVMR